MNVVVSRAALVPTARAIARVVATPLAAAPVVAVGGSEIPVLVVHDTVEVEHVRTLTARIVAPVDLVTYQAPTYRRQLAAYTVGDLGESRTLAVG